MTNPDQKPFQQHSPWESCNTDFTAEKFRATMPGLFDKGVVYRYSLVNDAVRKAVDALEKSLTRAVSEGIIPREAKKYDMVWDPGLFADNLPLYPDFCRDFIHEMKRRGFTAHAERYNRGKSIFLTVGW